MFALWALLPPLWLLIWALRSIPVPRIQHQIHRIQHQIRRRHKKRELAKSKAVDTWEQIRFSLLCCNRALQNEDVSRIIASFHKDLLHDDVLNRLDALGYDVTFNKEIDTPSFPETRTQELLHYMTYFVRDRKIFLRSLGILTKDVELSEPAEKQALFEAFIDIVVKGGALHVDKEVCDRFSAFIASLDTRRGHWRSAMVSRFLAAGGADVYVMQIKSLNLIDSTFEHTVRQLDPTTFLLLVEMLYSGMLDMELRERIAAAVPAIITRFRFLAERVGLRLG